MDWTTLIPSLLATQTPALPEPALTRIYLALGWALVLTSGGAWLAGHLRFGVSRQRLVGALVLLWCLWPGPWSPTYWLGLAFRAPSLVSATLCGWFLLRQLLPSARMATRSEAEWVFGGIVLGWLLLLDTFARWPVSLYVVGFSPMLTGLMALIACLPWLKRAAPTSTTWAGLGVLLVYGLLRLPTGNLWDAVLDPWLWIGLHGVGLRLLWRRWREGVT